MAQVQLNRIDNVYKLDKILEWEHHRLIAWFPFLGVLVRNAVRKNTLDTLRSPRRFWNKKIVNSCSSYEYITILFDEAYDRDDFDFLNLVPAKREIGITNYVVEGFVLRVSSLYDCPQCHFLHIDKKGNYPCCVFDHNKFTAELFKKHFLESIQIVTLRLQPSHLAPTICLYQIFLNCPRRQKLKVTLIVPHHLLGWPSAILEGRHSVQIHRSQSLGIAKSESVGAWIWCPYLPFSKSLPIFECRQSVRKIDASIAPRRTLVKSC